MAFLAENTNIDNIVEKALNKGRMAIPYGEVATYIPELAKAEKNVLGLCIFDKDGNIHSYGDCNKRFTIQSISKVISLALALEICGFDAVFEKVGMEPSGEAFNSLIELDLNSNRPFNPMINSGAITISSMLLHKVSFLELSDFAREMCLDNDIEFNELVYKSEMNNVSRNRAIAYLLESKGIIDTNVEESLTLYTKMCSLNVTAESLAKLGAVLALGGKDPITNRQIISSKVAQIVKTIMLTCGMYDGSGEFAVRVGIPTKSGVGGGLLSVVDKEMGIGVYGPALDSKGNCIAGRPMLESLSNDLGLHIF